MAAEVFLGFFKSLGFAAIALFFIQRYIRKMDEDVDKISSSIKDLNKKIARVDERLSEYTALMSEKISNFDSKNVNLREDFFKKIEEIRYDIMDVKSSFSKENDEMQKKYGKIIFKIVNEQETKLNKVINYLKKR